MRGGANDAFIAAFREACRPILRDLSISPVSPESWYCAGMKTEQPTESGKTHFEQISIAAITRMAAESPELWQRHVSCAICRKPLPLELCKTDEHGTPVHENCYVKKVAKTTRLRLLRGRSRL